MRISSPERTGVFTSGIVWIVQGRRIALFFTGCKHAGENLAEVLKQRAADCRPSFRCAMPYRATCRSCPRRSRSSWAIVTRTAGGNFVKVTPELSRAVPVRAGDFREVYGNDAVTREQGMSPEERLAFHQEHSKPVMEKLHTWLRPSLRKGKWSRTPAWERRSRICSSTGSG